MLKVRSLAAIILSFSVTFAIAQESDGAGSPAFGGPDAVENQLAKDSLTWNDWKKSLKEKRKEKKAKKLNDFCTRTPAKRFFGLWLSKIVVCRFGTKNMCGSNTSFHCIFAKPGER